MGYRGKVDEQRHARRMRAEGHLLADIAAELGVAKSSVSLWVRDIPYEPSPRRASLNRKPHPQHVAKLAEIAECDELGTARLNCLSEHAFLAAGTALYAGEGTKADGKVLFANTNPAIVAFFCAWLRHFFDIDESRLRARVYLHEDRDLQLAETHWSDVTAIPTHQFQAAYRAKADPTIRSTKHENGCAYVSYHCSRTHRQIMGLVRALLSSTLIPG